MRSPFHTPFAAVFANEVLLSVKRVAPYVLMALFAANALLWWARGPAAARGWATNSDFYIQRNTGGFSFLLGLPIFTAIIMGDAVLRDFRLGVGPLIFSKPVGRASYLLGKFFGNFFVLVCCQLAFPITFFLLQWVPFAGMVKVPVQVVPYFKHFFLIVVISHLGLAAIYFATGTLTRSAKVVYGMAACFYPAYIALQIVVFKNLPAIFGVLFDPMGLSTRAFKREIWNESADSLNHLVMTYTAPYYVNRASVIVMAAVCLMIVHLRFTVEAPAPAAAFTKLTLSDTTQRIAYSAPSYGLIDLPITASAPARERIVLPKVAPARGLAATLFKVLAATGVEFRLLWAERSILVLVPLTVLLSFFSVPFSPMATEVSYSVTSAGNTANMLLLVLACVIVFFTGEAMHRDREVKIEPVVWSTPAPNGVLLLSKFLAMTLLGLSLMVVGSLTTIVTQLLRGYTPVDLTAYALIDAIVVVPGVILVIALVQALNVLLRNKYLAYVVAVGAGAGLSYLYSNGYNHWLYNPLLYRLWTYGNLTSRTILGSRLYCFLVAAVFLALAHVCFERKSR
jgi:ABC-2 type transport system permease protein